MLSLLNLRAGAGLGPSLDPLLWPTVDACPGPALGLGGGGLVPTEVVLTFVGCTLRPGAFVRVANVFDFKGSGPDIVGRDVSSLLRLFGLGDLAGRGDLPAEDGLEMAGLVVLMTGCLTACGCQPVLRMLAGGECICFTGGLGLSTSSESVLFDLLREDLFTGGDFFAGSLLGLAGTCTTVAVVSLLFIGGEGSFLAADSFLSSFSLEGRAGAGDLTAGGVGVDPFCFLSR